MTQSELSRVVLEDLGSIAVEALRDIHSATYGRPPQSLRAWVDGDAILLVARLHPDADGGGVLASSDPPPLKEMQRMVTAAVYQRTGATLRPGGRSSDAGRGLTVLAFEHCRAGAPAPLTLVAAAM